ncbi:alpha/beta hydrolase [Sulfuriroseicoccus oceanibius]|uniref:Uncharacterized protein n=1 Tax=Sulfuriroseicoccus oceanibius TaxID=2707525 RepID=A0A6B3LE03_9BACT|nr:alpha/beta hydrolase [Sulfuriroseicoccus oceanibius]QQL44723.1 hypothetical protein G3M56_012695 [Sulfuriroseicoccus oceanibius]
MIHRLLSPVLAACVLAVPAAAESLNQAAAEQLIANAADAQMAKVKAERKAEFDAKRVTLGDLVMRYEYKTFGEEPAGGHSLYISLHGGGGAPAPVNDRQWQNQIDLYQPEEGIYVAPRAPTNTWDLWHQSHIDPMFDQLIEDFVAFKGVNPERVYILGYSAGGDGLYQLAPRMADRWAGAAMMAGHPGDAKPDNLLNLPFIIQCGGKDVAYERHLRTAEWGEMLDKLEQENPGFFPHECIVYPDFGHWMNLECKRALPWMAENSRKTWPKRLNWYQDNVTHTRFAWLANETPEPGDLVKAKVEGQTITLESENVDKVTLRLSDALVDLDQDVVVKNGAGEVLFKGAVERTKDAILESLNERMDPTSVATALLEVEIK